MPSLSRGDVSLYYEMTGEGPALLFLHGLGSSCRDWEGQVPFFSTRFRVIAMDCRGHGHSDKPAGPYSIPLFAADAAALIEALGLAPVHVVGLSMGGMIAFELAVSRPDLLQSLVIVNSGPALILRSFREKWAFFRRRIIVRFLGMRRMAKILAGQLLPEPDQGRLHDRFVSRWSENDRWAYLTSLKALSGWSVTDRLEAIRCPSLIISGDMDYTPVAVKEAYAARMADAQLVVIPHSRHLTPIDQAEAFNGVLMDFLSRR